MKKLFITEDIQEKTHWYLSYEKPQFQGGESIEIDEETAESLMSIPKLLDFIERWNKQDIEKDISDIANNLNNLI
ncbi:hypothetical protein KBA63_00740 [Candidatus Woesebacteria bacterium]|nr:hypothetical protein [Candidatus Woesebacteria bacterium]